MPTAKTAKKSQPIPRSVEEILLAAREAAAKSKRQFARSLGVNPSAYGRYESGKRNPPAKVINQALEVLSEQTREAPLPPTARDLAGQIERGLEGPEHIRIRQLLSELVGALTGDASEPRRGSKVKTAAKRPVR